MAVVKMLTTKFLYACMVVIYVLTDESLFMALLPFQVQSTFFTELLKFVHMFRSKHFGKLHRLRYSGLSDASKCLAFHFGEVSFELVISRRKGPKTAVARRRVLMAWVPASGCLRVQAGLRSRESELRSFR